MAITVRTAQTADLARIVAIAEARALSSTDIRVAPSQGFLVSGYSRDDYAELLERAEYFYVAVDGEEILGFVVAYGRERVGEDEWLNREMSLYFPNFTVIKQVATAPAASNRGVGALLYQRVLERNLQVPVIAAVVAEPPNRASTALHQKHGFRPVADITPPDGLPRTVWVKLPDDVRILEEQLRLAADLYKHEDLLNWQKLNNFLYVSAGLVALCGLALSNTATATRDIILVLTGMLGLIVSAAFFVMLSVGVLYLHRRKDALAYLERSYVLHKSVPIFLGPPGTNPSEMHRLRRSPSSLVLRTLPLVAGIGWIVLTCFGLTDLVVT
jgi:ribosomal protein S18 acetylase RimI-like enzyme